MLTVSEQLSFGFGPRLSSYEDAHQFRTAFEDAQAKNAKLSGGAPAQGATEKEEKTKETEPEVKDDKKNGASSQEPET